MPKQIDRNVILLGWVSFFTDMASAMITPVLPIFVVAVLHEGADRLGYIVAIATFFSYALRLLSGYISDRFAIVKPLVVSGYALSMFSKPLLAFSQGWKSVALLRGVERVGKGVRSAPKDVLIAHYSKAKNEGRTFGFHKTLDIAGELSGTLLLFSLLLLFGQGEGVLRIIFAATLLPGIVGLLLLFFVKDAPAPATKPVRFTLTSEDRSVVKMLFFYFLFVFFVFSDAFFTMRAIGTGFATVTIPLLFIVSTATQTFVSYPIGRVIDRIGASGVIFGAFAAGIGAQALLAEGSRLSIWAAYALLGLFTVASLNANRAYIAQRSDNRGSVYGIFYAGVALFAAAGAAVCGLLWEHFGAETALLFSLAGTAVVTAAYLLALTLRRGVA
jgi:MFS family permease